VGNFCTAWRKSIRRIWNLPYQAHGYLLSLLCGCLPVFDEICLRSVNFMRSCINNRRFAAILSSFSHGTAFSMDGLGHQLAVICCTVHSGIHVEELDGGPTRFQCFAVHHWGQWRFRFFWPKNRDRSTFGAAPWQYHGWDPSA